MFDNLTGLRERSRGRTAAGIAVSVLLHLALLALVVAGADAVRRGGSSGVEPVDGLEPRGPLATGTPAAAPEEEEAAGGEGGAEEAEVGASPLELGLAPDAPLPGTTRPLEAQLPDTLVLGRPYPVRLSIPPLAAPEDPMVRVSGAGDTAMDVRVLPARSAALYGTGVVVRSGGSALQLADTARPLSWEWTVRPTEPGVQTLDLRLEALAEVEGEPRVVSLYRTRREVLVREGTLQRVSRFFARHWTWLSLITLVLLLAWLRERLAGRARAAGGVVSDPAHEQSSA